VPEAYSIDGRSFAFQAEIADRIQAGNYVSIEVTSGQYLLGQVLELVPVAGESFSTPRVQGTGALVNAGEPFVDARLSPANADLITDSLGLDSGLTIGQLTDDPDSPASLKPQGFSRHTFVCGQSGSGKTYTTGVILERLLHETSLPIVILDPNSDYTRLRELRPQEQITEDDAMYRKIEDRHRAVAAGIEVLGGTGSGLRVWLGNLNPRQQATILGLDPLEDAAAVSEALSIVEELGGSRYNPEQVIKAAEARGNTVSQRLALRIKNLRLDRMSLWANDEHPAVTDLVGHVWGEDWRAAVFDLGSVDSRVERSILSAAVVGHIWDRRHERKPLLLVIDEAHNVCPRDPDEPNLALSTEHLISIAGEGRKYGIYLMLATQRPEKIHENVLSQCDNLVLMRINSRSDIDQLTRAFSAVPPALIQRSDRFGLGEGLAYGKIAPNPLLFETGKRITPEGGQDVPTDWVGTIPSPRV
jgi:DNA helicase HerA-like ATPase